MGRARGTGWLAIGAAGFLGGLMLLLLATAQPIRHLALIVMIAAPVTAFWRLMKSRLAPHCPRPPEPDWPA